MYGRLKNIYSAYVRIKKKLLCNAVVYYYIILTLGKLIVLG